MNDRIIRALSRLRDRPELLEGFGSDDLYILAAIIGAAGDLPPHRQDAIKGDVQAIENAFNFDGPLVVAQKNISQAINNLKSAFGSFNAKPSMQSWVESAQREAAVTSSELKSKIAEIDSLLAESRQRVSDHSAEVSSIFASAENARGNSFNERLVAIDNRARQAISKYLSEVEGIWSNKFQAITAQMQDGLNSVAESKEKSLLIASSIEDLYGKVGDRVIGAEFERTANAERLIADRFRTYAAYLMIGLLLISGTVLLLSVLSPTADWHLFAYRFSTILAILIPIAYFANEASRHRGIEKALRKSWLELTALNVYLAHMPEDKRTELRFMLAERFFGVVDQAGDPKKGSIAGWQYKEIMDAIKDIKSHVNL